MSRRLDGLSCSGSQNLQTSLANEDVPLAAACACDDVSATCELPAMGPKIALWALQTSIAAPASESREFPR
jgi:hypothetical protein